MSPAAYDGGRLDPGAAGRAELAQAQEMEDLADDLAFALYDAEKAAGTLRTVPHDEVRERLGLAE